VRLVATPLTIATFLLAGGTGLALFFDVHSRAIKELHEWSSIAMCGAIALHLLRNARPTLAVFSRWFTWVALGGASVAALWMLVFTPASAGPRHGREGRGAAAPVATDGAAPGARCDDCEGGDDCDGPRHDGRGRGERRGDGEGRRHRSDRHD
jgi:hypothetical protein